VIEVYSRMYEIEANDETEAIAGFFLMVKLCYKMIASCLSEFVRIWVRWLRITKTSQNSLDVMGIALSPEFATLSELTNFDFRPRVQYGHAAYFR